MNNPRLDKESGDQGHEPPTTQGTWQSSYRDVLGIREFRFLWIAHVLSIIGTNLLNIAASVLVYHATDSALAAGITLAVTFLPPIIAGPLLSGLADIFPRKQAIIVCDIARACVILLVGIPGMAIWAIWALLFLSVVPSIPFAAARAALLSEIIQGERYVASTCHHPPDLTGGHAHRAPGGRLRRLLHRPEHHRDVQRRALPARGPARVHRCTHPPRPERNKDEASSPGFFTMIGGGAKLVFTNTRLRTLALLAWLAGLYMIPYGIANPMADELGAGDAAVGLIMSGSSIGTLIGGFTLTRFVGPPTRMRLLGPLAVLTSAPLLLWMFPMPLWLMVTLLALSGAFGAYQIVANAAFVLCAPKEGRGLAFGLVAAGLQAAQGAGILIGGFFVELYGTEVVITGAGAIGVLGALLLAFPWSRLAGETITLMNED